MTETIKTYQGGSPAVSQCLVTLECFIGDVDNHDADDDGTFDVSDAVTAINGLIWAMETREAEHADMLAALRNVNKLISEAAMTGFNCKDGDWAERLFASQAITHAAIRKAEGRPLSSTKCGESRSAD